jgi:hypothetical protein
MLGFWKAVLFFFKQKLYIPLGADSRVDVAEQRVRDEREQKKHDG